MSQVTPGNPEARPACVGGLYEICVGVPDLVAAIGHFERFGARSVVSASSLPRALPSA